MLSVLLLNTSYVSTAQLGYVQAYAGVLATDRYLVVILETVDGDVSSNFEGESRDEEA